MGVNNLDPKGYWVGFTLVKGIGAVRIRALIKYFGNLETAWKANLQDLLKAGMSQKVAESILHTRASVDLSEILEQMIRDGISILTWEDPGYPKYLKEINQPPPVLYIRGEILPDDDLAVAVVGTRRITSYGRQVAEELGSYLARNGITMVSGMARGVDAVTHEAVLRANGRTLAVLGSGVDVIYPPEYHKLAMRIIKQGALLSDYPPGTQPEAGNFPPRNRIISGLVRVVIVVEAGETSGALITASFAAEQGRYVLAVPRNIYAPQSKGTNYLLQQGAKPLLCFEDVLETLNIDRVVAHRQARAILPGNPTEANILGVLSAEPIHIDEICSLTGLSIEEVSATLTIMELKGMVRQMGGMNYTIAREIPGLYEVDLE